MRYDCKNVRGLIDAIKEKGLLEGTYDIDKDIYINDITYFSGGVEQGNMFICKGAGFRKEYLEEAVKKGAVCYMSEKRYDDSTPCILVNDIRKAMSITAICFFDDPQRDIKLTGVTGTKGKTTTVFYIKKIMDTYMKSETALLSTVEINTGAGNKGARLTTPESLDLQRMLYEVRENDMKYLTMEVSSQAYKHSRVYGVNYDTGIFLNIDEDHIGPTEHDSYEEYLDCKLQLMKNCKTAVIMRETRDFEIIRNTAEKYAEKVIIIGGKEDDYHIENISKDKKGFSFDFVSKQGETERYSIDQEGRFNVKNAACAIASAMEYGVPCDVIKNAVKEISIPGRMNVFNNEYIRVIVDYAHNRLSLKELFESLKSDYPDSRIKAVCGSDGSRTQIRRRDIGTMCGRYADKIYLTACDPQFEDPKDICKEIAGYIAPYHKPYTIIEDRATAIAEAIRQADKGDIIVITGKGEEDYQKVNGRYEYYESDISVVKRLLGA